MPRATKTKSKSKSKSTTPPATTILLVRHGTTPTTGQVLPGRATGLHLAESGTAQAERVAERIRSTLTGTRAVAAVYASPMERTQETAKPIARAVGHRVRTRKGLLECDFGDWTGQKLKDLMKLPEWKKVQQHPSGFRFPGGESFSEMQTRVTDAIGRIAADHPGETVVAVSHADPIKAAVADSLGTHLDLFQRIVISPCSVSALMIGPSTPIVLCVNQTGDLGALSPS